MSSEDAYGLGYKRVDEDANLAILIATMDATSQWEATRELRAWERSHLQLSEGERLLDVGCGLGDAALALAEDLGASGDVVGVDVSSEMLAVARERSKAAMCRVRLSVGDALALDEPAASFDAVRSERTLQWVTDPGIAVGEMARVLRPSGRISLIDSDWSTLQLDVGDAQLSEMVREAMREERARPSNVGNRLVELVRSAGFDELATTSATHVWTKWDPDESPAPEGCFSMASLADDLVSRGQLDGTEADQFVATVREAARRHQFTMSLTMHAVVARIGGVVRDR